MFKKNALLTGLAAALLLAACAPTPTPTPEPTTDPALAQTQVAATIYAQLTQAVTPTLPPTATPQPTATSAPTATQAPTLPPQETATPAGPTPTKAVVGEAAKYLYTYPPDNTEVIPNQRLNIEWGLQNVGTTTWKAGYKLVWVGGERFTNQTEILLEKNVPPGEKGIFILGVFGSEDMKPHRTDWQLVTDQGVPVPGGYVYFTYKPV